MADQPDTTEETLLRQAIDGLRTWTIPGMLDSGPAVEALAEWMEEAIGEGVYDMHPSVRLARVVVAAVNREGAALLSEQARGTGYRARIREALRDAYAGVLATSNGRHNQAADAIEALLRDLTRDLSEQVAQLKVAIGDRAGRELLAPHGHELLLRAVTERARQIEREGWSPEHDDEHTEGDLADAAAAYASSRSAELRRQALWPWEADGFKPGGQTPEGRRRDLVKATALLLAEWNRMDRAAHPAPDAVSTTSPVPATEDARQGGGDAHSGAEGSETFGGQFGGDS